MSADEVLVTHLYKAFQTYVRNKPQLRAVDHLKSLHEYATIFDSFDAMPPGSAERSFFSRINTMEVTTAYPFLLELYRMHKDEKEQIAAVLTDLQAIDYSYDPGSKAQSADRRWLLRHKAGHRTHHLHVVEYGSPAWTHRIEFCERLKRDTSLRARYQALKISVLAQVGALGAGDHQ